jgi:hypothetical protein
MITCAAASAPTAGAVGAVIASVLSACGIIPGTMRIILRLCV